MPTPKHDQDAKRDHAATNARSTAQQHGESARQDQSMDRLAEARAHTAATMDYLSLAASGLEDQVAKASRRMAESVDQADPEAAQLAKQATDGLAKAASAVTRAAAAMRERAPATEAMTSAELREAARARPRGQDAPSVDQIATRDATIDDRLRVLAQHQRAEAVRLAELVAEVRQACRAFARDAQACLAQRDDAGLQRLRERAEQFLGQQRDALARIAWDGRFADVEAVQRTWERAAKNQPRNTQGYEAARAKFWEAVNAQQDDDAKEVHALLDRVGVEWQPGSKAPCLAMRSAHLDELRAQAERGDSRALAALDAERQQRLITIDHVADKGTHQDLAIDPQNLRFFVNWDNSARGKHHDAADRRKLDFERPQAQQDANQRRRDVRAGRRADQAHDAFEGLAIQTAYDQLAVERARARTAHAEELRAANAKRDGQAAQLAGATLPRMRDRADLSRDDKRELAAQLDAFLAAGRAQLQAAQRAEAALHARQAQELERLRDRQHDQRATMTVAQQVAQASAVEVQFAAERAELAEARRSLNERRAADERAMLRAIYQAETRAAQAEAIARAVAQQAETQRAQEQRLAELERKRGAHD